MTNRPMSTFLIKLQLIISHFIIYIILLGRTLLTSEGNLQGELGSGPFMIVWESMSARQATPRSYKFRIWKTLLELPLGHFQLI